MAHEEVQDLFNAMAALQRQCWRSAGGAVADRAVEKLRGPMAELVTCAVGCVLQEMGRQPSDPQVQTEGVHILRAVARGNATAKQIVLRCGGAEALVQGLRQHPTDEQLLAGVLEAIDEIHGLPSLLQALEHLRTSGPGVRAALWAFQKSVHARWQEAQELPPAEVFRVLLRAVGGHGEDGWLLACGLRLASDLAVAEPAARGAFAAAGGWEWLLGGLEAHAGCARVQVSGLRLLSALGRGGAWQEAHAARCAAALEAALCRHGEDGEVQHWGLWAVQVLNGARALVQPLRAGAFKTPGAVVAAMRCLAAASFGQSEGASAQDVPGLVQAVVQTMRAFPERHDVLCEASVVLGRAAAFAVWELQMQGPGAGEAGLGAALAAAGRVAVDALLELLAARLADHWTVQVVCEALTEILEACDEGSPVRALLCSGLFGPRESDAGSPGDCLLSRATAAHVSNDRLQTAVMLLLAAAHGAAKIVAEMTQHATSHAVQLPAIKALGLFYGGQIDLEEAAKEALPEALRAVIAAMGAFPENLILQQHGCYALCTMAEHAAEAGDWVSRDAFIHCAAAAGSALRLVQGRCDSGDYGASYNTLYLRKEATRCVAAICRAHPSLGNWLRLQGLHDLLADALRSTADSAADGLRDAETEETLCLEVLALSYVLGPATAVLEPLRRWGAAKPAVARAAADTVVELARAGGQAHGAPATPVQALHAAGCSTALLAAMQAHAADEELLGRLRLALGFVGSQAAQAA